MTARFTLPNSTFRKNPAGPPQGTGGYAPNAELLKKFNLPAEKAKVLYRPGKEIFDKRGKPSMCRNCQGTGFVGRTGVYEMIVLTDEQSHSNISTPPTKTGYIINTGSYEYGVGYGNNWQHVTGFSEAVINWIRALEQERFNGY